MPKGWLSFISLIIFILSVKPVLAVTVTISDNPSLIKDQPFEFNVSISGAKSGTNYLRADFYIPNTDNYFGYTFNGSTYYNGSNYSQYFPVTINSEGSASAIIKARADLNSNYYEGSGEYRLQVRRYTSSGYYTKSTEVPIAIDYSLPTPTPTPTGEPTPTNPPTPTSNPTSTKTPTPTKPPTPIKTPTPTSKPSPTPTPQATKTPAPTTANTGTTKPNLPPSILGTNSAQISTTEKPTPKTQIAAFSFKNILLFSMVAILILGGILIFTFIAKNKLKEI